MNRLRAALTALALTVTVLLSGCSQVSPKTAAVVEGTAITEATVDAVTSDYIAEAGGVRSQLRPAVARQYILGTASRKIAAERGIALTTGASDATAAKYPQLAELVRLGDDFKDVRASMTTAELTAALAAMDVTLNPRYGSWEAYANLSAEVLPTGSLSELAPRLR